jgi:hypothetical protein
LSQEAYDHVAEWVEVEKLEPVQVKGRQALTQIYDLK